MIKDEIRQAQNNLARLKETYKKLVSDIKNTFYDKENYFVDNSPRKPRTEVAKMQAAVCLAQGKAEKYSFELNIRRAEKWESRDNRVQLDYWVANQERFKNSSGIEPTIIIEKKNLKLLSQICRNLWVKEVGNSFRPNTLLGFEDWLSQTSVDDIFDLMINSINEKEERMFLVTDKNLYIKDIVVIFPRRPEYFGVY